MEKNTIKVDMSEPRLGMEHTFLFLWPRSLWREVFVLRARDNYGKEKTIISNIAPVLNDNNNTGGKKRKNRADNSQPKKKKK